MKVDRVGVKEKRRLPWCRRWGGMRGKERRIKRDKKRERNKKRNMTRNGKRDKNC